MFVKKSKQSNKVFGAVLTASEQKAMDMEIQRQIANYTLMHNRELEAMILWTLHENFGFGPKRLKRFYNKFVGAVEILVHNYELDNSDDVWICTHKLKVYGVDLEQWEHEAIKEEVWARQNTDK